MKLGHHRNFLPTFKRPFGSLKKITKEDSMRKYLFVLLALTLIATMSSSVKAGSPQQCKTTLDQVLGQLKSKGGKFTSNHFWTLPDSEICDFKRQANAAGLWTQFAKVCNSLSPEECKSCQCRREDFTNATACSLKCGHCWSMLGPCFQPR